MDDLLGGALVLGLVLTGVVKLVHDAVFGDTIARLKVAICVIVAVVVVLLISASDFASETVILKKSLASLNVWSQLVIALLVAGVASTIWQTLGAVRNVGENEVKRPTLAPRDDNPTPR